MSNEEYAINILIQMLLDLAIKTLEKQKATSELKPPTDDWETYANRLYDLAYLSGYNDGLIAKERKNTDGDNKRN